MVIFNSYVKLPEGTNLEVFQFSFPDQFRKEFASGRRVLDLNRWEDRATGVH